LTIESIAVSASEAGATASADVHGASSVESNDWALDPATLGTVQVDGSIEVSATELDANADLEINADKYDGLTVLGGFCHEGEKLPYTSSARHWRSGAISWRCAGQTLL
jgi:hypothetical protein